MDIYTAQYRYSGPDRLDITVKGVDPVGKTFAPTWDMVMRIKKNEIDEAHYEREYRSLMNERYRLDSTAFTSLASGEGTKTMVCFCPPGTFCHRIILVEGLEKLGATYKGERNISFENENVFTEGDMLEMKNGILCQQVNCRGVMGAGLAKAIVDRWPHVKEQYLINMMGKEVLGTVSLVPIENDLFVANLFGQDGYGREKRQTNYMALRKALRSLKKWRDASSETFGDVLPIYFPYRMSCGLAGGDWYLVYKMIMNIFPDAVIIRKS